MKNRASNKVAGVAILAVLIVISLVEMIFRVAVLPGMSLTTSNLGEPMAAVFFAAVLIVLTLLGKDRICYICYGAWLGYFILDQIFELPGLLAELFAYYADVGVTAHIVLGLRLISMVNIIVIGVLLVEYMNDGTIYNRAFNGLCISTVVMLLVAAAITVCDVITGTAAFFLLDAFNNLSRITMVFLFTFFAYDSAKLQLRKTDLSK